MHIEDVRISSVLLGLLQLLAHLHPVLFAFHCERIILGLQLLLSNNPSSAPLSSEAVPNSSHVLLLLFQRCTPLPFSRFQISSHSYSTPPGVLACQAVETLKMWLAEPQSLHYLCNPSQLPLLLQTLLLFILESPSQPSTSQLSRSPHPRKTSPSSLETAATPPTTADATPTTASESALSLLLSLYPRLFRTTSSRLRWSAEGQHHAEVDGKEWQSQWLSISHAVALVCNFGPRAFRARALMALQHHLLGQDGSEEGDLQVFATTTQTTSGEGLMATFTAKFPKLQGEVDSSRRTSTSLSEDFVDSRGTEHSQLQEKKSPSSTSLPPLAGISQENNMHFYLPPIVDPELWRVGVEYLLFPLVSFTPVYPFPSYEGIHATNETKEQEEDDTTPTSKTHPSMKEFLQCPISFSPSSVPRIWLAEKVQQLFTQQAAITSFGPEEVIIRKAANVSFVSRIILSRLDIFVSSEEDSNLQPRRDRLLSVLSRLVAVLVQEAQSIPDLYRDPFVECIKNIFLVIATSPAAADCVSLELLPVRDRMTQMDERLANVAPGQKGVLHLADLLLSAHFPDILYDLFSLLGPSTAENEPIRPAALSTPLSSPSPPAPHPADESNPVDGDTYPVEEVENSSTVISDESKRDVEEDET